MENHSSANAVSRQRRAGILLHPTSLPGPLGHGDFGHQAYRFIEFLSTNGYKVWQMLPLGPTHTEKSPYQCLSSHAGNPLLISLDWLEDKGWLDRKKLRINLSEESHRLYCLQQAGARFYRLCDSEWLAKLAKFKKDQAWWLEDYSLFMALKGQFKNRPWYEWPAPAQQRDTKALEEARKKLHGHIRQTIFEQFVFFTQWQEIRIYATQHDIELFGDMPIFVAKDSADVWAKRENFLMDIDGEVSFVAGVPPDAFSDTGQRWGNPLYDWEYMQNTAFSWWKERFKTQLRLFDMVRIDHFRGLQACWQIPQQDETAMNGCWVEVPGRAMLNELFDSFHHLPLVAEDLGVITDQVIELKNQFNLPGMKVLQFAFDGNNNNPHLPHRHQVNDVVYTGTHDNDTTLGWVNDENNYDMEYFNEYNGSTIDSAEQGVLSMIRLAMSSVSFLCILPMQDLLMLGSSARMNTPGTVGDHNWNWRFDWQQVRPEIIQQVSQFMTIYQR